MSVANLLHDALEVSGLACQAVGEGRWKLPHGLVAHGAFGGHSRRGRLALTLGKLALRPLPLGLALPSGTLPLALALPSAVERAPLAALR